MESGYKALTEREKQTLRLILHGHDAKSMARELDLSVHTVNEYLRQARRKLEVTSSKEAARMLFEKEGDAPHFLGHKQLGAATDGTDRPGHAAPELEMSPRLIIGGTIAMTLLIASLVFALAPHTVTGTGQAELEMRDRQIESAARDWLQLVDAGDWATSYAGTAGSFREANTLERWTEVSRQVRPPLGATLSRELQSVEMPPTPQAYRIVKFTTRFASREDAALETVTLIREDGAWKVAGIFIE